MTHTDRLLSKDGTSLQHKGHMYNKAENKKLIFKYLKTRRYKYYNMHNNYLYCNNIVLKSTKHNHTSIQSM